MESGVDERQTVSQADAAYATLRQAILGFDLVPGDQVTEAQLADRFGFGRAAVRTALTKLCHEQLVQVIPRRGYAVSPITFTYVRELFGIRLVVEPAAARLAADRADSALVAELERLNEACVHQLDVDLSALRRANKAFHAAIGQACGNERLAALCATVLDEMDRVLYLPQLSIVWERADASFEEHSRIIEAIRRRDGRLADQAAHAHITPNQRGVIDALTASPGLRFINLVNV